uniref:Uncharacterized protein n=1 Tax=Salix viminalis TaxID=40686 RepID=A0A6N2LC73_SALVM
MPSEDAKPVKKEEVAKKAPAGEEEDETKSLSAMLQARKKNPTNAGSLTTKSGSKATKVRKEEPQDDDFDEPIKGKGKGSSVSSSKPAAKVKKEEAGSDDDDDKPIFRKIPASKTDKKVKKEEDNKKTKSYVAAEQVVKRRERKVYDLPGQKRDPPEERDPLRIFYETLYEQIPESEMAQFWLMESGLLPVEMARKVHEKKQKKNKFTSPVKTDTIFCSIFNENKDNRLQGSIFNKNEGDRLQRKTQRNRKHLRTNQHFLILTLSTTAYCFDKFVVASAGFSMVSLSSILLQLYCLVSSIK